MIAATLRVLRERRARRAYTRDRLAALTGADTGLYWYGVSSSYRPRRRAHRAA